MDLETIVADAAAVASLLNIAIQAGEDIAPFAESLYDILVNKMPLTDAQRAANAAQEATLRAQLDAVSIPADQP